MSKLLYIQASPRGKCSYCVAVADAFVEAYRQKHPGNDIVTLNVFDTSIPNFDGLVSKRKKRYRSIHCESVLARIGLRSTKTLPLLRS